MVYPNWGEVIALNVEIPFVYTFGRSEWFYNVKGLICFIDALCVGECCKNVSFGSRVIARIFGCFVVGRRKLGIMHPLKVSKHKIIMT